MHQRLHAILSRLQTLIHGYISPLSYILLCSANYQRCNNYICNNVATLNANNFSFSSNDMIMDVWSGDQYSHNFQKNLHVISIFLINELHEESY
jgi:hypothetical protein